MFNKLNLLYRFILLPLIMVVCFSACKKNTDQGETISKPALPDTTLFNLSYGSNQRQVFDLYLPENRDTTTPIIIMIHGGAWKAGQKEDLNSYFNLLKLKWPQAAIANTNYRLASNDQNIHHDQIIEDLNSLMNHLNDKKQFYGISNKTGIMGASAGGQLAMIYAYKYNTSVKCVANIFGPSIINDWSWYNSTNLWLGGYTGNILAEYVGQSWDSLVYKSVSPYWQVKSTSAPTILFHGNLDPIVPVYQSQWLNGKLNVLGVNHQYHEYIAFHGFDNNQSDDVMNKLVAFFKTHLK
jgi:dipeptidyl aminopeptidase/acylaminoacyl peptidase